jgi:hypothetical protein
MDLSLKQLEEALSVRRQIDALQKRFALLLQPSRSNTTARKRTRTMPAATHAKIAAAAKARWARRKKGRITDGKAVGRKSGLTPAGRRKLSRLMKARWAARRKAASKK